MFEALKKLTGSIGRYGIRSTGKRSFNRYKAWRMSRKIDLGKERERWASIKDIYRGKRVFVIGNGPSLNKTPLYLLKDEYTMCFNRFHLFQERLNWKPDFFLTTDNLVLSDLIGELDEIVPSTTYSFFPGIHFRGENFIERLKKYPNVFWTIQVVKTGFSGQLPIVHPGGTVIVEGFQILRHLGFSEVYLIGVDMNYRVHDTAMKLADKGVDIISQKDDDPNHFDPRYFGKNRKYHQPEKFVIDNTIKYLEYVAKNAVSEDFRIINAGLDSKLECFPKSDFHDVLKISPEDQKIIFLDLLSRVSGFPAADVQDHRRFPEYDPGWDIGKTESFACPMEIGLPLIKKAVFTHIPVGPYQEKYYFIRRKREKGELAT